MSERVESGSTYLDLDYLGAVGRDQSDVEMATTKLSAVGNVSGFVVVPKADWATCSAPRDTWARTIPYSDLHPGVQICARSSERRFTRITIDDLPSKDRPVLSFYGYTWDHP